MAGCSTCGKKKCKGCRGRDASPNPEPARVVQGSSAARPPTGATVPIPMHVMTPAASNPAATTKGAAESSGTAGSAAGASKSTGKPSKPGTTGQPSDNTSQKSATSGEGARDISDLPLGKGRVTIAPGADPDIPFISRPDTYYIRRSEESVESLPATSTKLEATTSNHPKSLPLPNELMNRIIKEIGKTSEQQSADSYFNMSLSTRGLSWFAESALYLRFKQYTVSITGPFVRTLIENAEKAGQIKQIGYGHPDNRTQLKPKELSPEEMEEVEEVALDTHSHLKRPWIQDIRLHKEDSWVALVIVKAPNVEIIDLASDRDPLHSRQMFDYLDMFATHLLQYPGPASTPSQTKHLPKFGSLKYLALDLLNVPRAHDAIQHTLKIKTLETLILRSLHARGGVRDSPIKQRSSSVKHLIIQTSLMDTEALWQLIGSFKQLITFDLATRDWHLHGNHGRLLIDVAQITDRLYKCHGTTLNKLKLRLWGDGTSSIISLRQFKVLSEIMIQQEMVRYADGRPPSLSKHLPKSIRVLHILHGDFPDTDLVNLVNDDHKLPSILDPKQPYPTLRVINVCWPVWRRFRDETVTKAAFSQYQEKFRQNDISLNLTEDRK